MPRKTKENSAPEIKEIIKRPEKNGAESVVIMLTSIFLVGMVIAVAVGLGYTFNKKMKNDSVVDDRASIAAAVKAMDSGATTHKESQQNEAVEENIIVPEETKISPADININILNNGAPAGSAGKTKDLLVKNGYTKAVAGNSSAVSTVGTNLYYSEDKFKATVESLAKLLETNNSKVEISIASSPEQKSGDIVIILGK